MKPTTEGRFIGLGISRFSTGLSVGPAYFIRTALFVQKAKTNKGRSENPSLYLANYSEQLGYSKRRRRWHQAPRRLRDSRGRYGDIGHRCTSHQGGRSARM